MANIKLATLGGGCFWCIEAALNSVEGVLKAISGYSGGTIENPTYQQICQGDSGHAEVIQVEFDQDIISFEQLLMFFFQLHDPTQLNRQGNDIGTQYRSVIYYHDNEQRLEAMKQISELNNLKIWPSPIVTEISPVSTFYPAEDYHQNYANENTEQPYCTFIVTPKLEKFKYKFKSYLKNL
jgi:peptide-methionine (S)-S-oxide reductase